jgi:hypothetical protein
VTAGQLDPREHLSPRGRLPLSLLVLAAGPAAWIVQLIVDFGLASDLCRRNGIPRAASPAYAWAPESLFLVGVNLACLAVAVTGGFAALAAWRGTRAATSRALTKPVEADEEPRRFLAACGVMTAALFVVAILFDTLWPLFVPSCWRFTP